MERELWPVLYRAVKEVAVDFTQKYKQIPGWVIVLTMLWATLHDRQVAWACKQDNWKTTRLKLPKLPSPATMSRRVDSVATGLLMKAVEVRLRELSAEHPELVAFLDGKPLCVGGSTKDPDARYGRGAGVMAKGYKLHTLWSNRAMPEAWETTPMNEAETTVAKRLIPQAAAGGYLFADGNYDSSELFDLAFAHGYQLVTPLPKGKNPGYGGGHYQSPHRRRSIAMMREPFGRDIYRLRSRIERTYGQAVSFGGGLTNPPAWIRGSPRVRTWTWCKLMINAARIIRNKDLWHP